MRRKTERKEEKKEVTRAEERIDKEYIVVRVLVYKQAELHAARPTDVARISSCSSSRCFSQLRKVGLTG